MGVRHLRMHQAPWMGWPGLVLHERLLLLPERLSYTDLVRLSEHIGDVKSDAAPPGLVAALPESTFKARQPAASPPPEAGAGTAKGEGDESDQDACVVCMDAYKEGDTLKTLPCFHRFHKTCVEPWLQRQKTCPTCKHAIDAPHEHEHVVE